MADSILCCVQDYEDYALEILPKTVADYYRNGACEENTLDQNRIAFKRLRIRPRVLIDISKIDMTTNILGHKLEIPFDVSPTSMQKMAHPIGEIGSAKAVGSYGGIYILSTMSTTSIEEVAAEAPDTVKWLQLYIFQDRVVTRRIINRAENAGFKGLVFTVDGPIVGVRYDNLRNRFHIPSYLKFANLEGEYTGSNMKTQETGLGMSPVETYNGQLLDESISWKDVSWLRSITNLPIILKGILTAEDALIGADMGIDGIIVSNHGGRQLDTTPASIEALPDVVRAVGDQVTIMFDGGVRHGTDIFKALVIGAKLVLIGRPALWGLAHSGEQGVKNILNILKNEFRTTLALTGCRKLTDIDRKMVVHESYYNKL